MRFSTIPFAPLRLCESPSSPSRLGESPSSSPDAEKPSVAIIGGGLAGLAAAAVLGERGFGVELFEARRTLGGRAGSFRDPYSGELVDHCQHVSMGCCTNLAAFCRRNGVRVALVYKSKALNDDDFTQIAAKLQQPVLYAEPSIDITAYILEQLNARYAQRGGVQPPGQSVPRRQ